MTIITIEGRSGSFGPDIGRIVARTLEIDFVDRLLLAEVARRVGANVQAVAETERRSNSLVDRLARIVQRMLERSAVASGGGDPYFGPGIETLLARPYRELEEPAVLSSRDLGEQQFIDSTREVITDIAQNDHVVILSRGGSAILKDDPRVLRIAVYAYKKDRINRLMARERLDADTAAEFVDRTDRAQARYFNKAFGTAPLDPFLYHAMLNTSEMSAQKAADIICGMARDLEARELR